MSFNANAGAIAAPTAPPVITGADPIQQVISTGQSVTLTLADFQALRQQATERGLSGSEMRTAPALAEAAKAGVITLAAQVGGPPKMHRSRRGDRVYFSIGYRVNDSRFNPAPTGRVLIPDVDIARLAEGSAFQLQLEVQPDGSTVYCTANF